MPASYPGVPPLVDPSPRPYDADIAAQFGPGGRGGYRGGGGGTWARGRGREPRGGYDWHRGGGRFAPTAPPPFYPYGYPPHGLDGPYGAPPGLMPPPAPPMALPPAAADSPSARPVRALNVSAQAFVPSVRAASGAPASPSALPGAAAAASSGTVAATAASPPLDPALRPPVTPSVPSPAVQHGSSDVRMAGGAGAAGAYRTPGGSGDAPPAPRNPRSPGKGGWERGDRDRQQRGQDRRRPREDGPRGDPSVEFTYCFRKPPRSGGPTDTDVLGTVSMPPNARRYLAGCLPRQFAGHLFRLIVQDPRWREWTPADMRPPTYTDEPRVFRERFSDFRPLRTYLDGIDRIGDKVEMVELLRGQPFVPNSVVVRRNGTTSPPLTEARLDEMAAKGVLWYLKEANAAHGDRIQIKYNPREFLLSKGVAYVIQPEIKGRLVEGRKTDWRLYFIVSYDGPMAEVYLYRTPLHRPCFVMYSEDPADQNGHLTNLSLQRNQPGFSFKHYYDVPQEMSARHFDQVAEMLRKTMAVALPQCQSHDERGLLFMCVDVLIDVHDKVWLLEFNRHPGVSDYGPPIMQSLIDPMIRDAIYQIIVPMSGPTMEDGKWLLVYRSTELPHDEPNSYDKQSGAKSDLEPAAGPAMTEVTTLLDLVRASRPAE